MKNENGKIYLYGASDDLIEIAGAICDERGCYGICDNGIEFVASDGTTGIIKYNEDGQWELDTMNEGPHFIDRVYSVGEDSDHAGEYSNFTSYSDILVFSEELEWIKFPKNKIDSFVKE